MRRKPIVYSGIAMLALALGAEVTLRAMGYGDPPIFVRDPDIEYYAKAGSYRRFGHVIHVNRYGMRASLLGENQEGHPILLLGDSIVFGSYRVLDDELVSAYLAERLATSGSARPTVLNAACTSWGPVNQQAYLARFGTFDAKLVVWVLSSHDLYDVPVDGYSDVLPLEHPALALTEAVQLVRHRWFPGVPPNEAAAARSLRALEQVVSSLAASNTPLLVALHPAESEIEPGFDAGGRRMLRKFEMLNVPVLDLRAALRASEGRGERPYEDGLHLTGSGAKAVAEAIAERLTAM